MRQQPLYSDQRAPAVATHQSLVLSGGVSAQEGAIVGRNDAAAGVRRHPQHLYFGPHGKLYYPDGSAVEFQSVRKQLQDLRAEQRIR